MKYNLHTHSFKDQIGVLEIVNQYPLELDEKIPYFSIGIHPWYIKEEEIDIELKIIEEKLVLQNCLALGECGLDKRIETKYDLQLQVFEKQLELAKKYKKPLILHCVSAFQEVIGLKKEMQIEEPIIIHGFSKNIQVAKSLLDNGFYLSFGKYLIRNPELALVFNYIPDDCFFLETDTIEETIEEVYEKASMIKKKNVESLIEANFIKVFQL
ncbi:MULTISPECIES: TatD family hydrolase [Flavobacterium]|uniref:Hydrolase TatD n=2 Tax=Flavobacterium TaxID=237 RepID=A0A246GF99_9FLAO|nr:MULTISPECIES: TatD family hydrolase [Flavobacterium]OWP82818.1 hydrolase TatD [Flavobacterium davisii]RVU90427.1 TatD family deoxyribonuclease [Flavobacterium columnare]SPE78690.1 putative deoxyribonuclease YcfH [Flavobacterium columnare]